MLRLNIFVLLENPFNNNQIISKKASLLYNLWVNFLTNELAYLGLLLLLVLALLISPLIRKQNSLLKLFKLLLGKLFILKLSFEHGQELQLHIILTPFILIRDSLLLISPGHRDVHFNII